MDHRKILRAAALWLRPLARQVREQGRNDQSDAMRRAADLCERCARTHTCAQAKREIIESLSNDSSDQTRRGTLSALTAIDLHARRAGVSDIDASRADPPEGSVWNPWPRPGTDQEHERAP